MNHDFYSPAWTQHRGQFAADVKTLATAAARGVDHIFGRLTSLQFDAPWRRTRDTRYSTFR